MARKRDSGDGAEAPVAVAQCTRCGSRVAADSLETFTFPSKNGLVSELCPPCGALTVQTHGKAVVRERGRKQAPSTDEAEGNTESSATAETGEE